VSGLGADVDLDEDAVTLFGEGGGQAVLACSPARAQELVALSHKVSAPLRRIGTVGGDTLLDVPVERLREAWQT
jgi:phosphoribosylformylglycinamidine (FGAM) synthase-like enzyme